MALKNNNFIDYLMDKENESYDTAETGVMPNA
jgi:hypothetical protein